MLVHVPKVLNGETLSLARGLLEKAEWADGKVTAGHQSAQVKRNLQIPEQSPTAAQLRELVLRCLGQSAHFVSAALPQRIFPPLFNRYEGGMSFGSHVDNAVRVSPDTGERIRTDLSATLFLSDPSSYDGGELVVEDTYGSHAIKLPAGDLILYPASSLHHVTPVTRGARLASFFWIQSLVRDPSRRAILFDLDLAVIQLNGEKPASHVSVLLSGVYHNLLRQWIEP